MSFTNCYFLSLLYFVIGVIHILDPTLDTTPYQQLAGFRLTSPPSSAVQLILLSSLLHLLHNLTSSTWGSLRTQIFRANRCSIVQQDFNAGGSLGTIPRRITLTGFFIGVRFVNYSFLHHFVRAVGRTCPFQSTILSLSKKITCFVTSTPTGVFYSDISLEASIICS